MLTSSSESTANNSVTYSEPNYFAEPINEPNSFKTSTSISLNKLNYTITINPNSQILTSIRLKYRNERLNLLPFIPLDRNDRSGMNIDCEKLLKDFKRCKNNYEKNQLEYFNL